ncbi:hypothetical protein D3C77_783860 [compost metagenome]
MAVLEVVLLHHLLDAIQELLPGRSLWGELDHLARLRGTLDGALLLRQLGSNFAE